MIFLELTFAFAILGMVLLIADWIRDEMLARRDREKELKEWKQQ